MFPEKYEVAISHGSKFSNLYIQSVLFTAVAPTLYYVAPSGLTWNYVALSGSYLQNVRDLTWRIRAIYRYEVEGAWLSRVLRFTVPCFTIIYSLLLLITQGLTRKCEYSKCGIYLMHIFNQESVYRYIADVMTKDSQWTKISIYRSKVNICPCTHPSS